MDITTDKQSDEEANRLREETESEVALLRELHGHPSISQLSNEHISFTYIIRYECQAFNVMQCEKFGKRLLFKISMMLISTSSAFQYRSTPSIKLPLFSSPFLKWQEENYSMNSIRVLLFLKRR